MQLTKNQKGSENIAIENARLRQRIDEVTRQHRAPLEQPHCFIAQAPGYWARGQTIEEAIAGLMKQGARNTEPFTVSVFVGDDKARITQSGMQVEYDSGTKSIRIGRYKSIAAYARTNLTGA